MVRIDEQTKQERLFRVVSLLRTIPEGVTENQLADELSFERRTVNNYLRELEVAGRVYKEGTQWVLDFEHPENVLRPLELLPEQALTLYLAVRLLVKQTDKRNEAAESALLKLADMLIGDLNVGSEIREAASEIASRPGDLGYSRVFKTIMQSYLYRRAVTITYAPRGMKSFTTTLYPYLIEPSAIGYTTYIIGYSSVPGVLRTYKLERIQSANLTAEAYSIPEDFPGLGILRHSWSIMLGEELVEVVLRFHPDVVDRVNETCWHPSEQKSTDLEKLGWLRWSVQLADTLDIVPWIRGWGADVEVLAPPELRSAMRGESRRIAERYGWKTGASADSFDESTLSDDFTDIFGD